MELKINLEGIFADDDGNDVNDSIKNTIINEVSERIFTSVQKRMQEKVDEILTKSIKEKLDEHLGVIIPQLMDHQFTETTSWGEKKNTYTVRNRLLKCLDEQCVYKDSKYDNNNFTKAINNVVDAKLELFKKDFSKLIDGEFTKECLEHATTALQKRLGINK